MKKTSNGIYVFFRPILSFIVKVFLGLKIKNKEVLEEGPMVIVANHRSFIDPIYILASTKRTIHFFSKVELVKGWKKFIFNKTGLIAVDRKAKNPESLIVAGEYLKNGELVGIFPEATRNYSKNKLLPMKVGAAKLAIDNKVPIVLAIQTGKSGFLSRTICLSFSDKIDVTKMSVEEAMKVIKREMEKLITDR